MAGRRGDVLAVDDDPDALEAIAEALGTLGYTVWQAEDGETALVLAREKIPDVILLDVVMPGLDGYEVCRRLKSDPVTRLIPVVFLTGQAGREPRISGLEAGATDFLSKPCELTELEVRVRNLVEFRHLTEELDSAEEMVFSIARAVEARDAGTGDHCDRLAGMAVRLGQRLGLSEEALKALKRGAYLHDLGKVGIPDAVLLKPGRLSEHEWEVMRRHVEIGVEICAPLRSLRPVLPIIRHHHERLDGTGYPDGLTASSIPFLAKVFQVTDVFDAITNDRSYRKALSVSDAFAILRGEAGRGWWDQEIVAEFIDLVENGR